MSQEYIELNGNNKTYPIGKEKFQALKNVSLSVEHGELLSIMGASGSGKTTLLNIIGLVDRFDAASISLQAKMFLKYGIENHRGSEMRKSASFSRISAFYKMNLCYST